LTDKPNSVSAGLRGRCPACGDGRLFSGFLTITDQCAACGADFSAEDAGDGPAVFIMFAVGFIVIPLVLVVEVAYTPPMWVHIALWFPLCGLLIAALLRPFKGVLFALQYQTKAAEARLDADDRPADPPGSQDS
jgi:uncharacterized protein (DUF983 family)